MDETDRGKVVRFFLAGSVLCLVGMFFSFYLKGFILYGSQFGRKYKIIGVTYMTLNNQFYEWRYLNFTLLCKQNKRGKSEFSN